MRHSGIRSWDYVQCQVKTPPPSSSQWGGWVGVPGNSLISKEGLGRVSQERGQRVKKWKLRNLMPVSCRDTQSSSNQCRLPYAQQRGANSSQGLKAAGWGRARPWALGRKDLEPVPLPFSVPLSVFCPHVCLSFSSTCSWLANPAFITFTLLNY